MKWYVDEWDEVWNYVKMWLRHSIFKKGNIVLRLLWKRMDLWCTMKKDDPDSTGILKSYRWRVLGSESQRRFIWLSLRFEITDQSRSYEFTHVIWGWIS